MKHFFATTAAGLLVLLLSLLAPRGAGAQALRGTIGAGFYSSFSIRADGSLWATGYNNKGQLGDGTTTTRSAWVKIGTATNWVQVTSGNGFSLGLQADGSLWAWGDNYYGQLGTAANAGTSTGTLSPVLVGSGYAQVAAGNYHTVALKADGSVYTWGDNYYGQLGTATNAGTSTGTATPVQVAGTYKTVAAGHSHTLALQADGTLVGWGQNNYGQLGTTTNNGNDNPNTTPMAAPGSYTHMVAGNYHTLALRADGSLWSWGFNNYGQLGVAAGSGTSGANPTPAQVAGTYTQIGAGSAHGLGLRADGTLWAWGLNYSGQLGRSTNNGAFVANPTVEQVPGTYVQVVGHYRHTLALRADGTLLAMGENQYGQLGNATNFGTGTANPTPTATGTALPTRSTAAGRDFGLAVRADGTLWAWGNNSNGQLGLGTSGPGTGKTISTQVGTDKDWVQVAAGRLYSLGLKANGTAWAWGLNSNGELGDNTTADRLVPTAVDGGGTYTQLAAGRSHSLGLRADGTAWAWGLNLDGQLGDNTTTDRLVPTAVIGSSTYTQLAAGSIHSLGLRTDGTAWAWGNNNNGQLGNNTVSGRLVPTALSGTGVYTQLAAGSSYSLGLRADGTAWAWGGNSAGQLGNTTTTDRLVSTVVSGGGTYTQLAAGFLHSLGLRADGTAWAWGYNASGQLGDNAGTNRSVPTREATLGTGWTLLASGPHADCSLARTASGYVFASAGANGSGQLGDGTTTIARRFDRVSPLRSFQPLPVELTAFTARRTGPATVALAWATASETNNAGFTVEKSVDGVSFATLGFVAGAGTSATAHAYAYTDAAAPAAAYYRLAQRDADGAVSYAPVQFVPAADGVAGAALVLAPNPAHGAVQALGLAAAATLEVLDGLGRPVRTAPAGALSVAGLPAGLYLVRATAPGQPARTARLVVE